MTAHPYRAVEARRSALERAGIVRRPAVKDRFVVTDRATGKAWWQYGAATETPEAAAKRMTGEQLRERITALRAAGIFATA
jgi:hypothetical protein